ncbi:MAG: PHP domain-containing protein [Clostridia bacterium]|nr:PHP domain-containing protein [Clostridia bacterium]
MEKFCDLHTHSTYSDGTYTPAEILDAAIEAQLSAVALCDHNTVDGLLEFERYAEGKDVEAISGIEFSTEFEGIEVHILGLFLPRDSHAAVKALLDVYIKEKENSNRWLTKSLVRGGYDVDYDKIKEKYPNAIINRAHIAAELTEKGYTSSISEAMRGILSREAGHYVPPRRLSAIECIEFIGKIGAVSVVAHPFLNLTEEKLRELLAEGKKHGLCGIECEYSMYDEGTAKLSVALSREFGLLPSGGSDFHGARKPEIAIGTGKGSLRVPAEWMTELKKTVKE